MRHRRFSAQFLLLALLLAALPAAAGPAPARPAYATATPDVLDPAPAWSSTEADATRSVAWGDWDNDGDLDLAAGNNGNPIRVYENSAGWLNPTAVWSAPHGEGTLSIAWGDWDNDGDLDLAAGNYWTPSRVYENEGGTLTEAWAAAEEDKATSVAWGDYDGDGLLDLAVGNDRQPNQLYHNTGGNLVLVWTAAVTESTQGVAWGDWDNDGDPDLAVGNYGSANQVYENDGGTLTLAWSSAEVSNTQAVAWGDYDGDGALDLAAGNSVQPTLLYHNAGTGLEPNAAWSSVETDSTRCIAWGDWDSDGDLDLATGSDYQPIRVYQNEGGNLALAWTAAAATYTSGIAWGDWNNDGDLELAAGNTDTVTSRGYNQVYENLAGPMATTATWSSADEMDLSHGVAWGDWDGDGDLDLAVGNLGRPNQVYENDAGTLTLAWSSPESDQTTSVAWGDWDGDGDLDLAAGNQGQPNRVYGNDAGTLTLAWSSTESDQTTSVAWGDWDGDGDLDLAVGNQGQPKRVYENDGGTLSLAWSSAENDNTYSVAWGDWDGDGDLDLAAGNLAQPKRVYENDGGTLTLAWSSTESDNTYSVAWGDWDGDGDLDLAAGNAPQPNRVYVNLGTALDPAAAWSSAEGDFTFSVAWGDWDGDGDLDLAAGNAPQPNRVYDNLGSTLEPVAAWSSAESDNTYSIAWGDWDGDGDLDLVAGNGQAERLYQNNRIARPTLPNNPAYPVVYRPGESADAFFYSSAEILTAAKVAVWFRLYDAEGDPVRQIAARYSTDGGGLWHTATITGTTTNLSAGPAGSLHKITWNAWADGARGDNVVFRIISILDSPSHAGLPIQRPYISADTPPFRLRPHAVSLAPSRQLGIGPAGTVLTHTLTVHNRTGRAALFAVDYDSFRHWLVDGPSLVGPIPDLGTASLTVSTTVPAGPPQVLDVVTVTARAAFAPGTFYDRAHVYTFRGTPDVTLSVLKQAPLTVQVGTVFTYTLAVHNAGTSPAGGVVITETLPAEVAFAWASEGGVYSPTQGTVLWPDNILFPGKSLTVTVAVTAGCVPSGTPIVNSGYAVACTQDSTPVPGPGITTTTLYDAPVAVFSLSSTQVNLGEPVVLANNSQNATAFRWDFGDGSGSTLAEPQHTYSAAGTYPVTLTASNRCGFDQATATVTAVLFLQAAFDSNAPVCLGDAVSFTNTSTGTQPITYTWDFGDGSTSTLTHPTHTYTAARSYIASLHAVNRFAAAAATAPVDVLAPPTAGFTYTVAGLTVAFTNTSANAATYLWSFGDSVTATVEHASHTYAAGGDFTVTLTANGPCGSAVVSTAVRVQSPGYRVCLPAVTKGFMPARSVAQTPAAPAITGTHYFTDVAPAMNATAPGYGTAVAWGDYDGDGDLDLYVVKLGPGPGGESSALLRNDGSTFTDVTAAAGVGNTGPGVAAAWADIDNDGDLDLFVSNRPGDNALFLNDGSGHFQDVAIPAGVADPAGWGEGSAWADVDRDGLVDLYVANYSSQGSIPNRLFLNLDGLHFADVAAALGVADMRNGEGVAWADFDNDGDMDLYVANASGGNALFQQQAGGTFVDVTAAMHVPGGPGSSFGVAWGDYDNDGWLDLYVAQQGSNKLYRNLNGTDFADVTAQAGVGGGSNRWSLGCSWGDFDNDGWLDLYIANAVVTGYDPGDLLYHNEAGDPVTFSDVTAPAGVTNTLNARGCAWGDMDNDGALDLYVVNQGAGQPNRLFRNNGNSNHWLEVILVGRVSNRAAIGARVTVTSDRVQIREISGGASFASQDSLPAEFGLGSWSGPVSVTVRWPSGIRSSLSGVPADRIITMTEPAPDLSGAAKAVSAAAALPGAVLTYTVVVPNAGDWTAPGRVSDTLPLSVTWGNYLTATAGTPTWDDAGRRVLWSGVISAGAAVAITYQVTVQVGLVPGAPITNSATVDDGYRRPFATPPVTTTVLCQGLGEAGFRYTPSAPVAGQGVAFTATATGSWPITFTWSFGDGGVGSGAQVSHTYTAAGVYNAILTATNCATASATVVHTITVVPSCLPVSHAGFTWLPVTPTVGAAVTFSGTVDTGDEPITFTWYFGDSSPVAGPAAVVTHTYTATGSYTVVMTATNCETGTAVASHTVTVAPPPCDPVHDAGFSWTPLTPTAGQVVSFTAWASGTAPLTFTWGLGDGGRGSGAWVSHTYAAADRYTVTLAVSNTCGQAVAVHAIAVRPLTWKIYLPIVIVLRLRRAGAPPTLPGGCGYAPLYGPALLITSGR